MRTASPALIPLLRSDLQAEILTFLLLNPDSSATLPELAARTGAPVSSVHRELKRGMDSGVIVRDESSKPHRYRAAPESPVFEPLATLLERTAGVEVSLREAIGTLDAVEGAVIHGSWARGELRPNSDVDLLLIGDLERRSVRPYLREIERRVGRRLDLTLMSRPEFDEQRKEKREPLTTILAGPVHWIKELEGEPVR